MTAYDLGLDTTVRLEDRLGLSNVQRALAKVSDKTWYRTEGVPLWQSTSLLSCGTLVSKAQEYGALDMPPLDMGSAQ